MHHEAALCSGPAGRAAAVDRRHFRGCAVNKSKRKSAARTHDAGILDALAVVQYGFASEAAALQVVSPERRRQLAQRFLALARELRAMRTELLAGDCRP